MPVMTRDIAFAAHGTLTRADFAMRLPYGWLHIPSNTRGTSHARFVDRAAYVSTLARWAAQSPDWLYFPL